MKEESNFRGARKLEVVEIKFMTGKGTDKDYIRVETIYWNEEIGLLVKPKEKKK